MAFKKEVESVRDEIEDKDLNFRKLKCEYEKIESEQVSALFLDINLLFILGWTQEKAGDEGEHHSNARARVQEERESPIREDGQSN